MRFKIISLNLWEGGLLLPAALDFIRNQDPDILALQEVYDGRDPALPEHFRSWEVLRQRLKDYPHGDFAAELLNNLPEGKLPLGNAVLSKYPITGSETIFFDRPFDEHYVSDPKNFATISHNLQKVRLDTPDGEVCLINFHGVWDLDGDNDSPARRNMVAKLLAAADGEERVIITGDTNAKPTNPAMAPLGESFRSVFGTDWPTTFNMRRKDNPGYATAAVDLMYASPSLKVRSRDIPDVDVSDHLPLVVVLEV